MLQRRPVAAISPTRRAHPTCRAVSPASGPRHGLPRLNRRHHPPGSTRRASWRRSGAAGLGMQNGLRRMCTAAPRTVTRGSAVEGSKARWAIRTRLPRLHPRAIPFARLHLWLIFETQLFPAPCASICSKAACGAQISRERTNPARFQRDFASDCRRLFRVVDLARPPEPHWRRIGRLSYFLARRAQRPREPLHVVDVAFEQRNKRPMNLTVLTLVPRIARS